MKRFTFLLSFLFLKVTFAYSQDLPAEVNVIPPSPNVMSVNKFVDIPVSHYTGTPNISVPIYELKMNQLSLPIGLSYHASGLKVEEQASWVGAGWALNAGGNINRTIRGLPDEFLPTGSISNEGRKGFFHNHKMFDSSGNILYTTSCDQNGTPEEGSSAPHTTLDSLSRGLLDMEADLYSFSSPAGSGKFVFSRSGELVRISSDDIKITDHPFDGTSLPVFTGLATATAYQWVIKSPDGIIYEFSSPERTSTTSLCDAGLSAYDDSVPNVQSTWHLDKMSIGDEWIQFHYVTETLNYSIRTSSSGKFEVAGDLNAGNSYSNCLNTQDVAAKRLEKITTSSGYEVKFVASASDRLDLTGSKSLQRVEVSKDGNPIITYNLAHAYFGNNDKLKLLSVKQTNGTTELPGYTFEYDATHTFPAINSKSQDLWGYYNGKTNSNLIPKFKTYASLVTGGADRSASLEHVKVGTLTKITYPTGGHTSFDYELHDYYEVNGNHEVVVTASASGGTAQNPATDTKNFTVSSASSLSFFVETSVTVGGPVSIGGTQVNPPDSYVEFRKHDGTAYVKHSLTKVAGGNRYVLPVGDYQLYVYNEENAEDYLRVEFEQTESFQGESSGLRVSQITTHDPTTGKNLIKKIEYTQSGSTTSSGVLFTPPLLGGTEVTHTDGTINGQACTSGLSGTFLTVSSISQLPTSVYQGSHIGYSRVIESQVDPNDQSAIYPNGNTVFVFINDKGAQNHNFPYVPQEDVSFKNGKLLTQIVSENESGILKKVSETINSYGIIQGTTLVNGMKLGKVKTSVCYSCDVADYTVNSYSIRSTWHRLESTVVKAYDDTHDDSKVFENTKTYTYSIVPTHYLPVSQTATDSKGLLLKTSYSRDSSHPALITSATSTRDGASISSQKFTYHGNSPLMISRQEVDPSPPGGGQPAIPPSIPVVKYTYGLQNTIIESHQYPAGESSAYDRGIVTSFIWGYGNAHPIAQVVNAGQDDVAYSSFEASHKGNWTYTSDNKTGDGVTGDKHHLLTNNSVSKNQLTIGTKYLVSFWAKDGTVSVTGTVQSRDAIHGPPGGWQYYEKVVTGVSAVTVSGSAKIDELRIHPIGAEMTTFVYDPGVGRLSEMSPNGISTHYVYDNYNRLEQILDRDGNILKYFDYSYQVTIN